MRNAYDVIVIGLGIMGAAALWRVAAKRSPIYAKNCFYTLSPDDSFLIGESRALRSTYFASACSGHGFKFAPAIGDALANMAVGQQPHVSLAAFSAERFY
ncbi:hypothetical protein TU82_20655 [Pseudomonas orientalis]|nr:hypothetical protein TU82_20655 [Pseudomonas orientalis]